MSNFTLLYPFTFQIDCKFQTLSRRYLHFCPANHPINYLSQGYFFLKIADVNETSASFFFNTEKARPMTMSSYELVKALVMDVFGTVSA